MTLGAVRAVAAKYPELHIIHFDAHADLRDDYLGAKLSHACVLRRCHEILGDDTFISSASEAVRGKNFSLLKAYRFSSVYVLRD